MNSIAILTTAVQVLAPAGGGAYTPSLDFSDARNSQYSGIVV